MITFCMCTDSTVSNDFLVIRRIISQSHHMADRLARARNSQIDANDIANIMAWWPVRNNLYLLPKGDGSNSLSCSLHGPLIGYVKSRVVYAPRTPGTFSPPPRVSDPDIHHGTCVMHVSWCTPGSLTSGFLWNRWRGKRSRHSRCMRNPRFFVSDKRPRKFD